MPCDCDMANGVLRVWADESRQEELWAPPGTSTEFFSGATGLWESACCTHSCDRPAACSAESCPSERSAFAPHQLCSCCN